jgi:XTP/dITP diphosphohydrolase/tetrapyrrole methylase family protein/MazG family protein
VEIPAPYKKHGPAPSSVFKNLPPRLPALMFAEAVWKQIGKKQLPVGGSVDAAQVAALGGNLTDETLGRMLFELTAAAQAKGLDPEDALRKHATKVMRDVEARIQPATT